MTHLAAMKNKGVIPRLRVGQARPIPGTYPPNDETRAAYQAWIKAGEPATWPA